MPTDLNSLENLTEVRAEQIPIHLQLDSEKFLFALFKWEVDEHGIKPIQKVLLKFSCRSSEPDYASMYLITHEISTPDVVKLLQ